MSIDRALQINTAALAVMGAVFLGLGHESTVIPGLLALAAVTAVILTDLLRWLRLNRWLANAVAIAAVFWSLKDFFRMASEGQLLAIANMLVYLQVVLFFQEKTARVYWQLLVLSLLQVVVAAALDLGPQFGGLLGIYIVLSLSALVLLCIYRDVERDAPSRSTAPSAQPSWRRLLQPPAVCSPPMSSDDLRRGLGMQIITKHVVALTAATFLFTAVFFYATPRLADSSWLGSRGKGAAMTGFTPEVKLEEAGRIHLSSQVVMRVTFTRRRDRQPVPLVGDPYFHGAALSQYTTEDGLGRWIAPRRRNPAMFGQLPRGVAGLVRQDIVLELVNPRAIPAVLPAEPIGDASRELFYHRAAHRVIRAEQGAATYSREYRYALATPALRNGRQVHAIPHYNPLRTGWEEGLLQAELAELKAFDAGRFSRLAEVAARILREHGVENGSQLEKAMALERHFRTPELYRYSLNLDFTRNHDLDPIEDFVTNHRTGHCEYFASALALMLRSQGIPARLIVGYKGGEFNSLGRYYVVQQRHAHAWVEAWMPPGDVVEWEIAGVPSPSGCWYRLDPTPMARETLVSAENQSIGRRMGQAFDYLELLWRDYVLSLNAARQQDTFYDPLTSKATALPSWLEARSFHRWLRRWSARLGVELPSPRDRAGRRVFEGSLALLVAGGVLMIFLLVQGALLAGRLLRRWLLWRSAAGIAVSKSPEFYRRLERLLARMALRRRRGQTPQELANVAEDRLADSYAKNAVAHLPLDIVETYYRVRFGEERLDKREMAAIEQALAALVPAVSQARKR
jgi:hypothetical protein